METILSGGKRAAARPGIVTNSNGFSHLLLVLSIVNLVDVLVTGKLVGLVAFAGILAPVARAVVFPLAVLVQDPLLAAVVLGAFDL